MPNIIIISNNRAEAGPLASVVAALPEATVLGLTPAQQDGPPAQVLGFGLWWFTREFEERRPSLVVVLGDRYETLAAAQAAYFLRIPVAHIHGGETTTGAFDDAVRDSITRMSVLHFVATTEAADRVYALDQRVSTPIHRVGAPGLDGIPPQSARRDRKLILVTYHPETRAADYGVGACREMLAAVSSLLGYEVIFCGVNNDPGSAEIRATITDWTRPHGGNISTHIDHAEYVGLMQSAAVVVGNSSAGIIEAPWVGVPTVNIGARQDGREMAPSVIQAVGVRENILKALHTAIAWTGPWSPRYEGGAAPRIAKIVREFLAERTPPST
jgi:UDP-hydrolysing UDP-N-acetyl-D-glucosamine 2-epimerase